MDDREKMLSEKRLIDANAMRDKMIVKYKTCPYNMGIECEVTVISKCHECGWNPKVEKLRKEIIKNGLPCLFSARAAKNERC